MSNFTLFEFQERVVQELIEHTVNDNKKQTIVVKSPTGSGKTIILANFVDQYLNINQKTAIIWLCPGKGNLEEQSQSKMLSCFPLRNSQNLLDALNNGFVAESITFVNWELVTNKNNISIKEGERKNLFDRISEAHRDGIQFIIIIDEEHSNKTSKASDIIDSFSAYKIIRVSATPKQNKLYDYIEITDSEVIDAGLISKAIYINEGLENNEVIDEDYDLLIDLAESKRCEILKRYKALNKNINPLVLIQFPNGDPQIVEAVENKLANLNITYDNCLLSKWMSDDKQIPDNLTENNSTPIYLLMKQAISTGWDCPRAKILIKLREGAPSDFQIQTIGRIRRMPEAKHYDDNVLDYCYVYTLDEHYKNGLIQSLQDQAFEMQRLFLKDKCKNFKLVKQNRNLDFQEVGERNIFKMVHQYMIDNYHLTNDKNKNKEILSYSDNGFIFGTEIIRKTLQGFYSSTDNIDKQVNNININLKVHTHKHGFMLLHSIDVIKRSIGLKYNQVRTILERLFLVNKSTNLYKLLNLNKTEFYAFVINNESKLKDIFMEISSKSFKQSVLMVQPKNSDFTLPLQDFFRYDLNSNEFNCIESNSYKEYSKANITSRIRSNSEQLFELYCDKNESVDWVYKNGDTGQQYFSIIYTTGFGKQKLFYPDYIVKMKDGLIWIIETKGGESHGQDMNIDVQILNKFNALKEYVNKSQEKLNWGFVRNKDNELYLNNTVFSNSISDSCWVNIKNLF